MHMGVELNSDKTAKAILPLWVMAGVMLIIVMLSILAGMVLDIGTQGKHAIYALCAGSAITLLMLAHMVRN